MNVLYGSETGTAKDVAETLGYDLYCSGLNQSEITVCSIDEFDFANLSACQFPFIFILATTGQGEPPRNMSKWWKSILSSTLTTTPIKYYTVLGLGDSGYTKFNHVAKVVHRRLEGLGAELLFEVAYADERHANGSEAVVVPWVKNLLDELDLEVEEDVARPIPKARNELDFGDYLSGEVGECRRVTAESHWQDTRYLTIKVPSSYDCDASKIHTCLILPQNTKEKTQRFLNLFPHFPQTPQFFDRVKTQYDLSSPPRSYFFIVLSWFAPDETYREKLIELARYPQNRYEYVNRPRRTTLEVLEDFAPVSKCVPLEYIDELLELIRPREYSIAGYDESKRELQFIIAMVQYETRLAVARVGCLSEYLLEQTDVSGPWELKIQLRDRPSCFRLPDSKSTPIVMVGPGTGIAPFRFMIQKELSDRMRLYFGCRGNNLDFYFEHDLATNGNLMRRTAFSRQEPRRYVQALIKEDAAELQALVVEQEAIIYIAGNSKKMPEDVENAFNEALSGTDWNVERLKVENRYIEETWN